MNDAFDTVPKTFRNRAWYATADAYVFLVDQPHTFGHSQLRLQAVDGEAEEDSFHRASEHIRACIYIVRATLRTTELESWGPLASYTHTKGQYRKTVVLRISADEEPGEYKVHLVPYFDSHLQETNELYQKTHDGPSGTAGGLLHWLGDREVVLDRDIRPGRSNPDVRERIASFRLGALAERLRGTDQ